MKVLIIPTWYNDRESSTAGIFTKEFAQELSKKEEVAIFYPFDNTLNKRFNVNNEEGIMTYRYKEVIIPIPLTSRIVNSILLPYYYKKIIKTFKPDVIHGHVATRAGYYCYIVSKLFKVPYVISEHAPRELLITNNREKKIAQKVLKNSTCNIAVSENLKKSLLDLGKFKVIFNGIKDNISISEIEIDKGSINIAFVASFYNETIKGTDILLKAIKELKNKHKDILVHMVGDGTYKKKFEQMCCEYNIEANIKFYGALSKSDLYGVLKQCDFLVSASFAETFGLAIAEALYLGKPVVITKSGGPEDFVTHSVGVIVEKNDVNSLIEGINYIIDNFNSYDSQAIINYAKESFEMDNIINKHIVIYKNALERE